MVGGFAALGAATLLTQIMNFFLLAIAARRLGPEPIGSFAFAGSLAGYFAIPANFGIMALATRDVAREPEKARAVLAEVAPLHGALALVPYLLIVALAPLLGADELSSRLMPLAALGFLLEAVSLVWMLYGRERFVVIAVSRIAGAVVNFVLVLALVEEGSGADGAFAFAWSGAIALAVITVLTLVPVLRAEGMPRPVLDPARLWRRFKAGFGFGVAGVMISVYYSLDSVMLGYIRGTDDVGQYAVAYRLPLALIGLAALWGSVLYPHASAVGARDPQALRGLLGFVSSVAAVVALPVGVGSTLVGTDLMPQLFGPEFDHAGTPFVLLAWAAAVVMFTLSSGTTALALGEERHYVYAVTAGAAVNLLLNLAVIPLYGMTGAAAATVTAEVVVFAVVWRRLEQRLGRIPLEWSRIARAGFATAIMAPVVVALDGSLSAAGRVAVGAAVYAVAAVALGAVHRGEIRAALRRPSAA
jgi:O-antigen/teichoic acid export membrane protein